MVSDLISIAILAIIAYLWSARGFFSSFLHMACCIAAAAIAFALWEPCAYFLMDQAGLKDSWKLNLSWTLGLILPFSIALAILRITVDSLVRNNLDFDTLTNILGGLSCGLVSGFITVGVIYLAMGFLPTKADIIGVTKQPMEFESNGSLVRKSGMLIKADTIVAGMFSVFSDSTFYPDSGETLTKWRPDMEDEGPALRKTFPPPDGGFRHLLPPKGFEVTSRYTVKDEAKDVLNDTFEPKKETYFDTDGAPLSTNRVDGYVVRFDSSAKEKSGQVVVGNAQVALIVRNEQADDSKTLHPVAMISQASGDKPAVGRWRFNGPDFFIASVGGGEQPPVAFEFPIPAGYEPLALVVKGARKDVSQMKAAKSFKSIAERDAAIRANTLTAAGGPERAGNVSTAGAVQVRTSVENFPVRFANNLPYGVILQKDNVKNLVLNDGGFIIDGTGKFVAADLQNRGIDRALQVRGFEKGDDTTIMMVDMDETNTEFGLLSRPVQSVDDRDQPLYFIDTNNQRYAPVGYIFTSTAETWIKFTPGDPLRTLTEDPLARISRSTPGNKLIFIYRISKNVKLDKLAVGDRVVVTFKPAIEAQ